MTSTTVPESPERTTKKTRSQWSTILATGVAMYSMFFGAGNIVFPLALGQIAQDKNFFAILGLLITAVGVPFAGLVAMSLFDGDYKQFFKRLGVVPGFLLAAGIMGLIGPFGAMPRCIALAYSTANTFMPGISLEIFSAISCLVILFFTLRPSTLLEMIGVVLTPALIGSLAIIIIMGIFNAGTPAVSEHENFNIFLKGLNDGYQTMDLLGAFFFSSVVVMGLKSDLPPEQASPKSILKIALKASVVGAFLLAITYIGFSYVAALHSEVLTNVPADALISNLAMHILGPYAATVACIAVAFACLTTALALAAVFAEFIHNDVSFGRVKYLHALIGTLIVTYFVSTLNFKGIAAFLVPILQVCYPALIVLSILNILYKLYGFKPVKTPVLVVFIISVANHLLN